jgi:hypothetical protein
MHIVQGNNEPLATIGNWATTFDNCEDVKVSAVKLIAPIAILHHCKSAIAPVMKLVSLRPLLQQMRRSKTFVSSSWEATSTWLCHATINFVYCRRDNNENRQAEHTQLH